MQTRKTEIENQNDVLYKNVAFSYPEIENISASLVGLNLWKKFHNIGTEMIVTKMGRKMFPSLQIKLSGLLPDFDYMVMVDFLPIDNKRYRYLYHTSKWIMAGPGDPESPPRIYVHPNSPSSGKDWMKAAIDFNKIKLTNNQMDANGFIILNSMQRYSPRIHVVCLSLTNFPEKRLFKTFSFKETQFIVVTAYQNQKITQLKIACNPFAKGFRDSDHDFL